MTPELYWVRAIAPVKLAVMPRPRGDDWLHDEVSGWSRLGIDMVVSLLEAHEARALGLAEQAALCASLGIGFISFPIVDRGTPASMPATVALVDDLCAQLRAGRAVAIHCRAGIGRTGVIGACVLLRLGVAAAEVFTVLSSARGLSMPDTEDQVDWVARFGRECGVR